jgi:hypothetical protein
MPLILSNVIHIRLNDISLVSKASRVPKDNIISSIYAVDGISP